MYIGEHQNGPYALPSLVATIPNNTGHLLLEGPLLTPHFHANNNTVPEDYIFISDIDDGGYQDIKRTKDGIILGNMQITVTYELNNNNDKCIYHFLRSLQSTCGI